MKEEALFTSINYSCNCQDGWQAINEIKSLLSDHDFPLKLKFKDEDGKEGSVFFSGMDYFDRCPPTRKFKILRSYSNDFLC